jgi:hypothetical protein
MSTITTENNKAKIERQKVDRYVISSNQVTSYLQNQLGFPIGADYTRWTGVTANHSYVRMRVGIANKDIVAQQATPTNFVGRVLQENVAGVTFKDVVRDVLKPFMYPENFGPILSDPIKLNEMGIYGLGGNRLDEVIRFSQLAYVQEQKMWRVYLRPEKIIEDMLSDATTGKIDGSFAITGVFGTESDSIRWEVEITKGGTSNTELGVISLDKLFSN